MRFPVIDLVQTGKRIRSIADEHHTSVKEIQKYLNLSSTQCVYHWYKGRNLPCIDHAYALSKFWGITINDMMSELPANDVVSGKET